MLERSLEAHFRKVVRAMLHGKAFKVAPTVKGMPDRLVLLPGGRIELVELKTETGRLSPLQVLWHAEALAFGTEVTVLYGKGAIDLWAEARMRGEA
jgi:hypothetical protein